MALFWLLWLFLVAVGFCAVLAAFFDGSKLQPSWRETLIRHCDEQHAAIMRGDMHLGIHGKYPPAIVTAATPYAVPAPVPYHPN